MSTTCQRPGHILIVEDDRDLGAAIATVLARRGHQVDLTSTGSELRSVLEVQVPELVLLDLHLPDENGLDLLPSIKDMGEEVSVMVITGDKDVTTVVEAMKRGADHFVAKPFDMEALIGHVDKTLQSHRLHRRASVYQQRASLPRDKEVLPDLVGSCDAIKRVRELVAQVAATDASVVLLGETGTGKGMTARGIHKLSRRASGSFVDINCASIQPDLLESEIFGHEKGAFTGASMRKPGLMEIADGGTLFLDEIAEMEPQAQSKLLTALENHCFRRVGGVKEIRVDVRVMAATHHDLEEEVAAGKFRADLFYRLNVFEIALPSLRERLDDILELSMHFVQTLNPVLGRQLKGLSNRAVTLLSNYHWPGNVRELRNVLERAMILAKGSRLHPEHFPMSIRSSRGQYHGDLQALSEVEREHIERVLSTVGFNIKRAARVLGISRSTLYAKMTQHGIRRPSE